MKFKEEDQSTTKDEVVMKEVSRLKAEQEARLKGKIYVALLAKEEPRVKEEESRFFEKEEAKTIAGEEARLVGRFFVHQRSLF